MSSKEFQPHVEKPKPVEAFVRFLKTMQPHEGYGPTIVYSTFARDNRPLQIIGKTRERGNEKSYGISVSRLDEHEEINSLHAATAEELEHTAATYQLNFSDIAAPMLFAYAKREGTIPQESLNAIEQIPGAATTVDRVRGERIYHVVGNQVVKLDLEQKFPVTREEAHALAEVLDSSSVRPFLQTLSSRGEKAVELHATLSSDMVRITSARAQGEEMLIANPWRQEVQPQNEIAAEKMPENFDGKYYFPKRIVDMTTPRMQEMLVVIDDLSQGNALVAQRLKDLIVHNACGRVFPIPNSAGDLIPIVDERDQDTRYTNTIALIKRKDGRLAVPGGFNDIGESIVATIAREGREEIRAKSLTDLTFIGERSNPGRDARFNIMSTSAAGVVKLNEIRAGDDAQDLVVVPLEVDGNINPIFLQRDEGVLTTATGEQVSFAGMYSDHGDILDSFYKFWQQYGQPTGLTLRETLALKKTIPSPWYENVQPHTEGTDAYTILSNPFPQESPLAATVHNFLPLTPNIEFTLDRAMHIFTDSGMIEQEAKQKATELVFRLEGKDVLPPFPQAAVTIDCVVLDGDNMIVHQLPTGEYVLPGSFYSPEKVQVGANIQSTAREFMMRKYGADFNPIEYIGEVGGDDVLGRQADPRYPRVSHVLVGRLTATYEPTPGPEFPEGTKVVAVPIWEDKQRGILSHQIQDAPWKFDHNKEILQTLFAKSLAVADPKHRFTAEQAFRHPQIKLSRETRDAILAERIRAYRVPSLPEWVSAIRQPADRSVFRESMRRETKNQIGLFGSVVGGERYREEASRILRDIAGDEWEASFMFNPVITDRPWNPEVDGVNEAVAAERSAYVLDVIKTEYAAVGSMVETPLLGLFSILYEHPIAYWIENPDRELTESEKRARRKIQIELRLLEGVMPDHIRVYDKGEKLEEVMEDAYRRIKSAREYPDLDEERQRIFKPRGNLIPRVIFSGSSYNPDREYIMTALSAQKPEVWQEALDTFIAPGSGKTWNVETDVAKEFNEKFNSLINVVDVRIDPNASDSTRPYGALEDVALAMVRAALSGSYAIINMPKDPANPKSDYNRARALIDKQFRQIAMRFPWIHQYVRFVENTDEMLTCVNAVMKNYTPPVWE